MEEPVGDGHESQVAFGPAPDEGDCSGTATDISSANYLDSGNILVPADAQAPRLSFDHYVVTEVGFDGGNAQLSVDGGEFSAIWPRLTSRTGRTCWPRRRKGSTNPL